MVKNSNNPRGRKKIDKISFLSKKLFFIIILLKKVKFSVQKFLNYNFRLNFFNESSVIRLNYKNFIEKLIKLSNSSLKWHFDCDFYYTE